MATVVPKEAASDGSSRHERKRKISTSSYSKIVVKFRKCTFLLWTAATLFLIAALIVFIILFAIWAVKLRNTERNEGIGTAIPFEDYAYCNNLRVCKRKFDVPPLFIISSDGFRNSYLAENITPAIQRVMDCGTHSKYMIPAFPSKTFPNHYTIATGLYPAWNGIIDNHFYDPNKHEFFPKGTNQSEWFLGQPIWEEAEKSGLKSAVYFWPGSEALIDGRRPTYYEHYDHTVPFSQRIDKAIEWLNMPDDKRPHVIQVYFEQPDYAGHEGGPYSEQVRTAMILIDGMVGYLTQRLIREDLMGCVNLILLSDHGMQEMNKSRSVLAENYLGPKFDDLFFNGVVARIQINQSAPDYHTDAAIDTMISSMECRHGDNYLMYKKNLVPIRFHYAGSPRIGDVVIKGRPGVCIFLTKEESESYNLRGDHGFDNRIVSMRAIFVAIGPDFAEKREIQDFENIELYNLFTYLLRIEAPPNNGTNGTLFVALRNPPPVPETATGQLSAQCTDMINFKRCNGTYDCPVMDLTSQCTDLLHSSISAARSFKDKICHVKLCDAIIHFDSELKKTIIVEGIMKRDEWIQDPGNSCSMYIDGVTQQNSCEVPPNENYTTISLFANIDLYNTLDLARIVVPEAFANGLKIEGTWRFFLDELGDYLAQFVNLSFFSGAVYDQNGDGVRDDNTLIRNSSPSHIFFVLLRCRNGAPVRGTLCKDVQYMPYILPIDSRNFNCLDSKSYLFDNTARLRDIELLTGMQFFTDRDIWSAAEAIQLRTWLPDSLWS